MIESITWWWRDVKRIWRKSFPEPSKRDLIILISPWWMWRHGVRDEMKISLYKGKGWYCPDLVNPDKKRIVEADGAPHFTKEGRRRDMVRDFALNQKGYGILRVTHDQIKRQPDYTKRQVRRWLIGKSID